MKIIRPIVEKLSRGKVIKRNIHLREKTLPIYVSPDSQLKYLHGNLSFIEKDLLALAESFVDADSVVYDVGANCGILSIAAAGIVTSGQIIAIEADNFLNEMLERTRQLDAYKGIDFRVIPAAVANKDGIAKFAIAMRGRASNALSSVGGRSQTGGIRQERYVPLLRLDTIRHDTRKVDFIKVDVEGAEVLVLKGMVKILEEDRPVIYIEIGTEDFLEVSKLLSAKDYELYDVEGAHAKAGIGFNYFAIPVGDENSLTKLNKFTHIMST